MHVEKASNLSGLIMWYVAMTTHTGTKFIFLNTKAYVMEAAIDIGLFDFTVAKISGFPVCLFSNQTGIHFLFFC